MAYWDRRGGGIAENMRIWHGLVFSAAQLSMVRLHRTWSTAGEDARCWTFNWLGSSWSQQWCCEYYQAQDIGRGRDDNSEPTPKRYRRLCSGAGDWGPTEIRVRGNKTRRCISMQDAQTVPSRVVFVGCTANDAICEEGFQSTNRCVVTRDVPTRSLLSREESQKAQAVQQCRGMYQSSPKGWCLWASWCKSTSQKVHRRWMYQLCNKGWSLWNAWCKGHTQTMQLRGIYKPSQVCDGVCIRMEEN